MAEIGHRDRRIEIADERKSAKSTVLERQKRVPVERVLGFTLHLGGSRRVHPMG